MCLRSVHKLVVGNTVAEESIVVVSSIVVVEHNRHYARVGI